MNNGLSYISFRLFSRTVTSKIRENVTLSLFEYFMIYTFCIAHQFIAGRVEYFNL